MASLGPSELILMHRCDVDLHFLKASFTLLKIDSQLAAKNLRKQRCYRAA